MRYAEYTSKSTMITTYEKDFKAALSINLKIINDLKMKLRKAKSPSFFMSSSGIDLMGALYYQNLYQEDDWADLRNEHINELLENSSLCFDKEFAEDEILYGNAGYMYCLLTLLKECEFTSTGSKKLKKKILDTVNDVFMALFNVGLKIGKDEEVLLYRFPRRDGTPYLGGAHGTIGILYMLL